MLLYTMRGDFRTLQYLGTNALEHTNFNPAMPIIEGPFWHVDCVGCKLRHVVLLATCLLLNHVATTRSHLSR